MTDRRFPSSACRPSVLAAAWAVLVFVGLPVDADTHTLARTRYTNGAAVRRAFGEVVTEANEWTVRVKSDDEVVAYGTIVRGDGYIVSKASQLTGKLVCRLSDGRELPAAYVGYDAEHDVALLKVDAEGLNVVRWQEQADPAVGRWVVTPDQQGAPNGVGVVSVARRKVPRVQEPAILGIRMKLNASPVVVQSVAEGSAAERAHLQSGDVIYEVDDALVASPEDLKHEISRRSPGDTIRLRVERDGAEQMLRATLTHPFGEFQSRIAMQNHMGGELSERRTGFPVVLQHDTVLSPDECGGPLVDLSGLAVGINIARAGRTETYAIPDDVLRPLVEALITGNHPPPGDQQPTLASDLADDPATTPPESDTSRR